MLAAERGKDVGNRLLNMYFKLHKDTKSFTLWCNDENHSALKLYKRVGTAMSASTIQFLSVEVLAYVGIVKKHYLSHNYETVLALVHPVLGGTQV